MYYPYGYQGEACHARTLAIRRKHIAHATSHGEAVTQNFFQVYFCNSGEKQTSCSKNMQQLEHIICRCCCVETNTSKSREDSSSCNYLNVLLSITVTLKQAQVYTSYSSDVKHPTELLAHTLLEAQTQSSLNFPRNRKLGSELV